MKNENKSKSVYVSQEKANHDPVTYIKFMETVRGKCDSQIFQITAAKNEYDQQLILSLQRASGGNIPYKIHGEALVRQFMADVVGYSLLNPNPLSWMKTENMIDGEVEVFYSNENNPRIQGISPMFPQRNQSKDYLNVAIDKKLDSLLGDDSEEFGRSDEDQDYHMNFDHE